MSNESTSARLPAVFRDLEPLADYWALPTHSQRHDCRNQTTMDEIQDFYDVMLPQLDAIADFLADYSLSDLPEDVAHLSRLAMAFIEVSLAVELFKEPDLSTGLPRSQYSIIEPEP